MPEDIEIKQCYMDDPSAEEESYRSGYDHNHDPGEQIQEGSLAWIYRGARVLQKPF